MDNPNIFADKPLRGSSKINLQSSFYLISPGFRNIILEKPPSPPNFHFNPSIYSKLQFQFTKAIVQLHFSPGIFQNYISAPKT
jgi:hypothetical protein